MSANIEMQSLISVGIPTYNRPEGLRRILECITRQTYKNLEIIVSDNCSEYHQKIAVQQIMLEFMAKDQRIGFYEQPINIGAGKNFQFCLSQASGQYFMWAADDDYFFPTFIEKCFKGFSHASSTCVAVGSEAQYFSNKKDYNLFYEAVAWHEEFCGKYSERMKYAILNAYGDMFYSLYKTDVLKHEEVTASLITQTGNEIPFYVSVAYFGSRFIIKEALYKKFNNSDSTVNFARWQAIGGYVGRKEHWIYLKSLGNTLRYFGVLKTEVSDVLNNFERRNKINFADFNMLKSAFEEMRNNFIIQNIFGIKKKRSKCFYTGCIQHG